MPGDVVALSPLVFWLACFGAIMLGGMVKGALGVGLPLVVLPLLSLLVPAPRAMGLLVMPVLLSNLWQAIEGKKVNEGLRRFGGLLICQFAATLAAIHLTRSLSVQGFNFLLAVVVMVAVGMMAVGATFRVNPGQERWVGPLVGGIAGVMAGISTLTGPILIAYLLALKLHKEEFIRSISIIYLLGSVPMYGTMMLYGRFGWTEVALSALALIPMFVGLRIGRSLRHRLSETVFRRLLLVLLSVLAVLLITK